MLCSCRFEKTVNKLMFLDQIAGYLEFLLEVYQIYSFHLFETIPRNELFCYVMVRNISVAHIQFIISSGHCG